ncbi:YqfB [Bacillus subtilis]|nr:YqfB [Bacillus subtilis]
MEDLLTNPLIIAAIIGIISAIFGKKSKEEKQNSQKEKNLNTCNLLLLKRSSQKKMPLHLSLTVWNRQDGKRKKDAGKQQET